MDTKRFSGLDFSDSTSDGSSMLDQHPDMFNFSKEGIQPGHLRRNKTERLRLQGLQKSTPGSSINSHPEKPQTLRQRVDIWMINDGGKQVFFSVWIFLHILVAAFGFLNYQVKDNLVTARSTFGVTYGEFFGLFIFIFIFIFIVYLC